MTHTLNTQSSNSRFSHEMIAKEERLVAIFLSSFAIQFFLHKDMLQIEMNKPVFLLDFLNVEITASQRIFIKNIIGNKKFEKIIEEIRVLFLQSNYDPSKTPDQIFLNKVNNKPFFIRQIFKHVTPVLEKFQFLDSIIFDEKTMDIKTLKMNDLHQKIWNFPVEQQILILVRIFSCFVDDLTEKRKKIIYSFGENVIRTKEEMKRNKNRYTTREFNNIVLFEDFITKHMTNNDSI